MSSWGPERKRDAAMFNARRIARYENMNTAMKWSAVEMWVRRAQKHFPLTQRQIGNLIALGGGPVAKRLNLWDPDYGMMQP